MAGWSRFLALVAAHLGAFHGRGSHVPAFAASRSLADAETTDARGAQPSRWQGMTLQATRTSSGGHSWAFRRRRLRTIAYPDTTRPVPKGPRSVRVDPW